ncbi:MAG: ABC transporter permease [Bacteroidia bacterium]
MIRFIIRRLLYGVLVMLGIIGVVFMLFMVLPDPARLTLGQRADAATAEAVNRELGLDKPWHTQLRLYLNDLSPLSIHADKEANREKYRYTRLIPIGDNVLTAKAPYLRRSYQSRREVSDILWEALPKTAILALTALLLAVVLGIPFGVFSALNKYKLTDNVIMVIAVLGISIPSFFSGILISWFFGFKLHEYTGLDMFGSLHEYDAYQWKVLDLKNLILPAITLGIRPLAIITQLTRSSMVEVLSQDYIRTAVAKGIGKRVLLYKHALRNALNPVLTAVSGWLASLMAGAFFVEFIFDWKGLGLVTVNALATSDFPVVMGVVLLIGALFVAINIIVDVLYGVLDPRIRL